MSDTIDELSSNVKKQLGITAVDANTLDASLKAVSKGFYPLITVGIVIGSIVAWVNAQQAIAVIVGLVALWDIALKCSYDNSRLHVLANAVSQHISQSDVSRLKNRLANISLSSLRQSSWHTGFSIIFPSVGGTSFPYSVSASLAPSGDGRTAFDASRYASPLCPGVFVQFHNISISLKCDFRVIRTPMTREEVAAIFRTVVDTLPSMPAEGISVRQYSSTKNFLFTQDYVDSGTIAFIKTRTSQRNLHITNERRKLSQSHATSVTPPASSVKPVTQPIEVPEKQKLPSPMILKRTLLMLSDLVEQRKDTEGRAMQIAMDYEISQGRIVEDVSSQNMGFDVLSKDFQGNIRRIEVKGLSGIGDVILTENEIGAANKYSETYWLYVVENCQTAENSRLYMMRDLTSSDMRAQTVSYEIDLHQQNMNADETYIFD